MEISRLITGILLVILGVVFFVLGFFAWPVWIYSGICLVIGFLILINFGREQEIERIVKNKKIKY